MAGPAPGRKSETMLRVEINYQTCLKTGQCYYLHSEAFRQKDDDFPEPTEADRRAFRVWAAKGVAIVWGPLVPMALLAWWWLS